MIRDALIRTVARVTCVATLGLGLAATGLAQDITEHYRLEGQERDGGRYGGRVIVWVEGDHLALSTWDLQEERPRPVARTAGLDPDASGYWWFRFDDGAADAAPVTSADAPGVDAADGAGAPPTGIGIAGALGGDEPAPVAIATDPAPEPGSADDAPAEVTVLASALRLRAEPSLSAPIVGRVLRGERHRVLESRGAWRRLDTPHGVGWAAHHHPISGEVYLQDAQPLPPEARRGTVLQVRQSSTGLEGLLRREGEVVARERVTLRRRPAEELIFVGMGNYAHDEARDLRNRGVRIHQITQSLLGEDRVRYQGRQFDLAEEQGRADFVARLGLRDAERAQRAAEILAQTRSDARDELARLMAALLEAERSLRTVERAIFSGHSVGSGVWGDDNGSLSFRRTAEAFGLFPEVTADIEDLMIAGCYSASPAELDMHRGYLPNLKTYWAYGRSAPGSWSGAMIHNSRWEAATRGHAYERLTRHLAENTRKGESVATWNVVDGFQAAGEFRSVEELRATLAEDAERYREFFEGIREVADTQYGPLRDYYASVQELRGNRGISPAEREELGRLRDQVIRLIFFDHRVKHEFQREHADELAAGYAALALEGEVPDFGALSRAEAMAEIARFEQAVADAAGAAPAEALEALRLLRGLRDLTADVIPDTWV